MSEFSVLPFPVLFDKVTVSSENTHEGALLFNIHIVFKGD